MKAAAKKLFQVAAPNLFEVVQTIRARRYTSRLLAEWGLARIDQTFLEHFPLTVRHGPFEGMSLSHSCTSGALAPRILGSYEMELWPTIEEACARPYERVVDVGCAEGYYAVGLARRLAKSTVIAFDLDPLARRVCAATAALNDVGDRVQLTGRCSHRRLQDAVVARSLIVSDCEGYEFDLLDPDEVENLRFCDLIVEMHPAPAAPSVNSFCERFTQTHAVRRITAQVRIPTRFAELEVLAPDDRMKAIGEVRMPNQEWVFLEARA